jgi:hypothetical protein
MAERVDAALPTNYLMYLKLLVACAYRAGQIRNAIKHGEFAAKTLALKREIQALARMARETMAAIE